MSAIRAAQPVVLVTTRCRLDLVEARSMTTVEQAGHLRKLPAEPFRQVAPVEPGGAHRAIGLELGHGQSRQRPTGRPSAATAGVRPRYAPFSRGSSRRAD